MKQPIYFTILAGGKGERLWPLSRKSKPKQLLPFDHNKSLLELTIDRIQSISDKNHRLIITTQEQKPVIQELVGNDVWHVIAEPSTRNTAPAILLTCLWLANQDPNAYVVFLPADHYFPDAQPFCDALSELPLLTCNKIGLIGIKPTYPATGYGYIEFEKSSSDCNYHINKFHEKPTESIAKQYCKQENMLWNIGVFGGNVTTFIAEYKEHAPQLYNSVVAYMNQKISYDDIEAISIDYAVMEKSSNLLVIPLACAWSDVGNLNTFLSLQNNNGEHSSVISIDSHDNLVSLQHKLIALIGVDNLCVVETDDVILISARQEAEKVKLVLQELKKNNYENYL